MKNVLRLASVVAFIILLQGCGKKENDSTSATTKVEKATSVALSDSTTYEKESTTQNETAGESSSPTQQTSPTSPENGPDTQATKVLQELNRLFPQNSLPTKILTSENKQYLGAATTKTQDQQNFRILYYAEDKAISVNDQQLNQLHPIASFEKKTFADAASAAQSINYQKEGGSQTVDLGYGLKGYMQGAAGSAFLNWYEGNWQLEVRAINIQGEDPLPLAKEIVNLLEKETLPAPKTVGKIQVVVTPKSHDDNLVMWQNGATVYKITNNDTRKAIEMAVSTN